MHSNCLQLSRSAAFADVSLADFAIDFACHVQSVKMCEPASLTPWIMKRLVSSEDLYPEFPRDKKVEVVVVAQAAVMDRVSDGNGPK